MSEHRYAQDAITGDLVRGGGGLALALAPLLLLDLHWVVAGIFGLLAVLFGLFLLRTLQRALTRIELTESGIAAHGPAATAAIAWPALSHLSLRYYSTRRDRKNGWMQLRLAGGGRILRLESTLAGFEAVAARAAAAATANRLALTETTGENLSALGIGTAADGPSGWLAAGRSGDGEEAS